MARRGFFHHTTVYAGSPLCGDSSHGHVFPLWARCRSVHNGMHHQWVTVSGPLMSQHWSLAGPCISGKFRHSKACMGVLVLLELLRWEPPLPNDVLRIGYGQFIHGQAPAQFYRLPRSAPATDSSSYPNGVVGGSKQEPTSMAGSTPDAGWRWEACWPSCSAPSPPPWSRYVWHLA